MGTYEDGTECSKTSAYKIQTPAHYPEESIQHSEHSDSLKSRKESIPGYRMFVSNPHVTQAKRALTTM
jgi:hypothetical protein